MELSTSYCPKQECSPYGLPGFGHHRVRRGQDGGLPRLKCNMCQGTFSARQGTAYADLHTEERIYTIGMGALAEGNSLRGTAGSLVLTKIRSAIGWIRQVATVGR